MREGVINYGKKEVYMYCTHLFATMFQVSRKSLYFVCTICNTCNTLRCKIYFMKCAGEIY